MPDKREILKIVDQADRAFNSIERKNAEHVWDQITQYMLNNQHGLFMGQASTNVAVTSTANIAGGAARTQGVYDSTAMQSVQDLASSFQGTITNPATVWSSLKFQDDDLNNIAEAVQWLEQVNRKMHNEFNESNFNTEIAKGYQSFVSLANMLIFFEENDLGGFRFTSLHLAQVAWAENKDGIVDTVFRKFQLTAKQAFEKWGTDNSEEVLKAVEKEPDKIFDFLHCVKPRKPSEVKLNELGLAPGNKRPIASVYMDMTKHHVVEESGYYEFPILAARWGLMPTEIYGRGPGHIALPDVKTLNTVKKRALEAIALQVSPPVLANQRDIIGPLNLKPKGISIVKDHNGFREWVSQARNDIMQFTEENLRNSIKSIFFLDKLLLPPRTETGEMTAFEVSQRIEQMQRVLGPTLSRLNNELLSPLVVRAFKILLRNGQLPEQPEILKERGINVEIVFVNQLARSQQIQDVNTIQQWLQGLALVAQLNPEIVDMVNGDGIAKHTAKILGVPEVAVQNDDVVAQNRQARAQQAQQAQALEAGVKAADIAAKTGPQQQ